jgi:hypothetical protein
VTSGPATSVAGRRAPIASAWAWPINPDRYDRSERIGHAELAALRSLGTDLRCRQGERDTLRWHTIARLARPLDDARAALRSPAAGRHRRAADDAIAVILAHCAEVTTTYWSWPAGQWLALAGTTAGQFKSAGPSWADGEVRPYVVAFGYLLTGFDAFNQLGAFNRRELCYKIFGKQLVDNTVGQVADILAGWGYQAGAGRGGYQVASVLCQLLLHNRSPLLEDLSTDVLAGLRTDRSALVRDVDANPQGALPHPHPDGQGRPVAGRRTPRDHRAKPVDQTDLRLVGGGGRPDAGRRLCPAPGGPAQPRRCATVAGHEGPHADGQPHLLPRLPGMGVDPAPV